MSVELYYNAMSPPSRAVLLAARALDIALDLKEVNIMGGENKSEEFLKMNPQHTIPFLADGDLYLAEGPAIIMYLADSYAKDDALYPRDVVKRATIHQRMLYNVGTLFPRLVNTYIAPVLFRGTGINEEMMPMLEEAFNTLNTYLDGNDWLTGDAITIADYATVPFVSTAEGFGFDVSQFENVAAWLARCKEVMEDYDDLNQNGVDQIATAFAERLSQIEG